MAQHDYIISNQTFPNTRADLNNVLQAIATCNKGSSAPTTQYAGQMWIDDSAGTTWTLYLYDGSDNIQVATIDTTANTINFIDSVVTGFDIVTDTTPQLGGGLDTNGNNINFGDNDKAKFGTSGDLQVYHDGSHSYIKDQGTGNLNINGSSNIYFNKGDGSEVFAHFADDGAVKLRYDNVTKFQTTSTGVDVTGDVGGDTATISGNVLVGTTSASGSSAPDNSSSTGDVGARFIPSTGFLGIGSSSNAIFANRIGSDGEVIRINKDGTEVGSIGSIAGDLFIGNGDTAIFFNDSIDSIFPVNASTLASRDGAIDLGRSSTRFKNLYLNGGAVISEQTLTDGATISWDVSTKSVAKVTLGGNRTISAPSNALNAGQFVSLLVIQDGTGSRTLTWNAVYEFASDTAPTLTTTGGKGDLFVFRYNGTKWLEVGRNLNLTLS